MTVTYTAEVATSKFICFLKLFFKWRGSIYKLLWKDLLVFVSIYYLLAILYNFGLNPDQKKTFEKISRYCEANNSLIPVAFVLGFFVNLVVNRWWSQINHIPWPDRVAMCVTSHIRGLDERGRLMRRTVMRYICLSYVIMMSTISPVVKKRFPTFSHMTAAGFMLENEQLIIESIKTKYNKYFVPLAWCTNLIHRARQEQKINDDFAVKTLTDEVNEFRTSLAKLYLYDWIPIPLVYTQVVTVAVHMFSLSCLMGRQFVENGPEESGFGFPIFTFLQYIFYMGWLKVAECLLNPFGEDDEDFDINTIIDRNIQVAYMVVDEMHNEHPELIKDQYWDETQFELPYTEASVPFRRASHLGSAMKLSLKDLDIQGGRHGSKRHGQKKRQNSTFTEDNFSCQISMDNASVLGHTRHRTKGSIDSTDTDGKLTPFQRQGSFHNEGFVKEESFRARVDSDPSKGDSSSKIDAQEIKCKLENAKKILEPVLESEEPISKGDISMSNGDVSKCNGDISHKEDILDSSKS